MNDKIRVFLVDDNSSFRKGMRALLEIQPDLCVVGEASNGRSALDSIERLPADLVLLDAQMPGMNGVEVARMIKIQWPQTKVVILTMFPDHRLSAIENGADAFLTKDLPPEQILSRIRGIVKRDDAIAA